MEEEVKKENEEVEPADLNDGSPAETDEEENETEEVLG